MLEQKVMTTTNQVDLKLTPRSFSHRSSHQNQQPNKKKVAQQQNGKEHASCNMSSNIASSMQHAVQQQQQEGNDVISTTTTTTTTTMSHYHHQLPSLLVTNGSKTFNYDPIMDSTVNATVCNGSSSTSLAAVLLQQQRQDVIHRLPPPSSSSSSSTIAKSVSQTSPTTTTVQLNQFRCWFTTVLAAVAITATTTVTTTIISGSHSTTTFNRIIIIILQLVVFLVLFNIQLFSIIVYYVFHRYRYQCCDDGDGSMQSSSDRLIVSSTNNCHKGVIMFFSSSSSSSSSSRKFAHNNNNNLNASSSSSFTSMVPRFYHTTTPIEKRHNGCADNRNPTKIAMEQNQNNDSQNYSSCVAMLHQTHQKWTTQMHNNNSALNMLKRFLLVVIVTLCIFNIPKVLLPKVAAAQHAKQVATIPGQLVIGALFSIREQPTLRTAATRTCGEVREQYGIHRVEAAFQTIDAINRNPNILPNISLGIEIRDSCWYSAIALEQSIEFIRDAMAASEEKAYASTQQHSFFPGSGGVYPGDDDHDNLFTGYSNRILGLFPASPFAANAARFNMSTPCPKAIKKAKNIVGVIGPASSTNSIQVQNLLQLFNIPQIGYSSTSKDLSAKNFFKFFLRVVPSDYHQTQVFTSIFLHYNWTYISVVYTDGSYGNGMMEIFKTNAQEVGICIAYTVSIPPNGDDELFDQVLTQLIHRRNAKVVACFCEGSSVRALLQAKRRLNITTEFLLVGSDGWSDRPDVVKGYEKEAQGSITVRIYSQFVTEFDDYYFRLNPLNNLRNPWFNEFWETMMNCSLRNITGQVIVHPNNITFTRQCTGEEKLSDFLTWRKPRYKQDNKMSFVVKAIWTMAHGLHNMQKSICKNVTGLCNEMLPVNGSILLSHLNMVRFKWNNEIVEFDENGDPPGRYDIMNYQEIKKGEYDYVQVGDWKSGDPRGFRIYESIQWPRERTTFVSSPNYTKITLMHKHHSHVPESVCSKPCPKGQAKNYQSDSVKCCWICVPCRENEYLANEEKCKACAAGFWPNENLTGCNPIPVEFLHWTDTASLVAIGIAISGFVMTLFTMVVFIRHNDTPVVKASTRELSYMIMFGMFLCYATTFALIAKPTKLTCYITRVLPGLSFGIIYAALVTKTNRIARILAGSKKRIITKKPRFMSATAQVVITWLLISVEIGIIVTVLIREPADKMLKYPALNRVVLTCNTKVMGISAPLGFDFVLIGFCTLYAIKTRNVPENFNEAKFIGFTMYTTLVIWIAFVPIYYNSDESVITLSLCISFSAIVALVLLFFPKLYIMLFKPEKNNRSYFTTAKNVRCHIGYIAAAGTTSSTSQAGVSRHSSHSTSEFSMESPRNYSVDVHQKRPELSIIHNSNITSGHFNNVKRRDDFKVNTHHPKPSGGFFSRLRISKQDKIAANVQEHIRAVRAAEALDRQTHRNRRLNVASQSFSEKQMDEIPESSKEGQQISTTTTTVRATEDSITLLGRMDTMTRRIRIVRLLRRTFGDDLEKLPQFAAIVNCLKNECAQSYTEIATQTNELDNDNAASAAVVPSSGGVYRQHSNSGSLRYRGIDYHDNAYQKASSKDLYNKQADGTGKYHRPVSKTLSSDESILSTANSVVVEENVSSQSEDSSQASGVYKNIIINLSNLVTPEHQSAPECGSSIMPYHHHTTEMAQRHGSSQHTQSSTQLSTPTTTTFSPVSVNNNNNNNNNNNSSFRTNSELVSILKKSKG